MSLMLRVLRHPWTFALDTFLVRWTGISWMDRLLAERSGFRRGHQFLAIETTGRRSGRKRRVAVVCFTLEGHLLVAGSKGGAPRVSTS